jgi:CubicO group peptidase (beta-lactamase class C family)
MKKSIQIMFNLFLLIPVILSSCSSSKSVDTVYMANNTSGIKEKILKIENGLLPAVVIENENSITYSIIERMQYYDVPGLSIAVIKDNKIEWAKSYGLKEKGTTDIVTLNTMFQAASMSKPITGIVAVKLAEQGKIDLYKSVNEQLKSWQIPENEFTKKKAVTPELLLLHLGGLNVHGYHGYSVSDTIPTIIDILNGTGSANSEPMKVIMEPGTKWKYSGGGYTVLQLLMEEVSGKSFPQLMKENLFDPLGIKNSTFSHNLSRS